MKAKYGLAGALVVLILAAAGAGAYFYLQPKQTVKAPVAAAPAPAPAVPAVPPAPAPAAPAAAAAPTDCLLPGPPPVPPDGSTASDADMKLGHDAIQAFVLQLEAYQACRNAMIDHAPPGTPDDRKQLWVQQGNAAIDEAHALADGFAAQLKLFHARHK